MPSQYRLLIVAGCIYAMSLLLAAAIEVDPLLLIIDSADAPRTAAYVGLFSNLGILLWTAAGSVCMFVALSQRHSSRFLLAGGLLTIALAADDFFLLHDTVIPQKICYAAYAAGALLILFRFRHRIRETGGALFVLAGCLLAGSITVDILQNRTPIDYATMQMLEEGLKFVGVVAWACFWLLAAHRAESPNSHQVAYGNG